MKKIALSILLITCLLAPAVQSVQAQEITLAELIELFISLGVIAPDKVDAARSISASQTQTTGGGGGTSCASVSITRWITFGAKGEDVTRLQQFLKQFPAWYPEGEVTGYFGTLSVKALQRYQAAKGIASSGTPDTTGYGATGPQTRAALGGCHSGASAYIPTNSASSTISVPAPGVNYPINQNGAITVKLGSALPNTATQARFYIQGGKISKWLLIGTEQLNHKPTEITHVFAPQTIKDLQPGVAYAISVALDTWQTTAYANKEYVYLNSPLFFVATESQNSGTAGLAKSEVAVPSRGAAFPLDRPLDLTVKLKSTSSNTATQARFYITGGVFGKNWQYLGTEQSLFRPTDFTHSFIPSNVTTKVGTTTVKALALATPYSIAVSVDEWQNDKYVKMEDIYLTSPVYFSDKVVHGVSFAPSRGLSSSDMRWDVFEDLREMSSGDISVSAVDLNGDGVEEIFGYTRGGSDCISGRCKLYLYRRFGTSSSNYAWQSFFWGNEKWVRAPQAVMVLTTGVDGWKDVAILAENGKYDVWRNDDGIYRFEYQINSVLPGDIVISTDAAAPSTSGSTTSGTTTSGSTTSGTTTSGSTTSSVPPPPPPPPPPR